MSSCKDEPLTFSSNASSSPIIVSEGDSSSYLVDPNNAQIGSASGSFQSDNLLAESSGSDLDYGFFRPDFRQNPLVGTVQHYDRHVFLCYKNPRNWPPRIEAAEFDRLPRLLSAALAARKGEMNKKEVCHFALMGVKVLVFLMFSGVYLHLGMLHFLWFELGLLCYVDLILLVRRPWCGMLRYLIDFEGSVFPSFG